MKYKGRQLLGPRVKIVPVIRDEGNIYFQVQGVTDYSDFDKLCPYPQAPFLVKPGGQKISDTEDPIFVGEVNNWFKKRTDWIAISSLRATEELEWDKVKYNDSDTWKEWTIELQEAGLVDAEIGRLINAISEVNGVNEALVEEARQSFLAGRIQVNGQFYHQEEQKNISSGKPA